MIWIRVRRSEADRPATGEGTKITPCAVCGEPAAYLGYDGLDPNEQRDPHTGRCAWPTERPRTWSRLCAETGIRHPPGASPHPPRRFTAIPGGTCADMLTTWPPSVKGESVVARKHCYAAAGHCRTIKMRPTITCSDQLFVAEADPAKAKRAPQ